METYEHERYHLFIIYKNKQVNSHRKDTLSKIHLLISIVFKHKKKIGREEIVNKLSVSSILNFLRRISHSQHFKRPIRIIEYLSKRKYNYFEYATLNVLSTFIHTCTHICIHTYKRVYIYI